MAGFPPPVVPLKDHCTAIYNGTLYAVSPDAFQSVGLSSGAQWKQLEAGVGVAGAACVVAPTNDGDSLFVLGGNAAGNKTYSGLQRYNFQNSKWETIKLPVPVTQNRRNHASIYLPTSKSILVFSGSQDGNLGAFSTQSFTIDASPPYRILSHLDLVSPPSRQPYVQAWNDSTALVFGGMLNGFNHAYFFSREKGWEDSGMTINPSPPDRSIGAAAIINGSDGRPVLQIVNTQASPNIVNSVALTNTNGASIRQRRQVFTIALPVYNGAGAPTATQQNIASAQDGNGLLAITGDNTDAPFVLFNATENAWVDGRSFYGSASGTVSIIPTASGSIIPIGQPEGVQPVSKNNNQASLTRTLGITLGVTLGILALILMIFFLMRWRKRRHSSKQRLSNPTFSDDGTLQPGSGNPEKPKLSFGFKSMRFFQRSKDSVRKSFVEDQGSLNSHSSLAIITGEGEGQKSMSRFSGNTSRGFGLGLFRGKSKKRTDQGLSQIVENAAYGNDLPTGYMAPLPPPPPAASSRRSFRGVITKSQRSSGWSRYFSGNNGNTGNIDHVISSRRNTTFSRSSYGSQPGFNPRTHQNRLSQPIAPIPPLNVARRYSTKGEPLTRGMVADGSSSIPNIGHPTDPRGTGLSSNKAHEANSRPRHVRQSSSGSSGSSYNAFASGIPESIHEAVRQTNWPVPPNSRPPMQRPPSMTQRPPSLTRPESYQRPTSLQRPPSLTRPPSVGRLALQPPSQPYKQTRLPPIPHPPSSIYDGTELGGIPETPATPLPQRQNASLASNPAKSGARPGQRLDWVKFDNGP